MFEASKQLFSNIKTNIAVMSLALSAVFISNF